MTIKKNNSKKLSILNSGFTPESNGVIVSTVSCSDEDEEEFDVNIFDLESVFQTEMTFSILCEKGKFKKVLFYILLLNLILVCVFDILFCHYL